MSALMVAVFNHDTARFFSGGTADQLIEGFALICPETRLAARDIYSDAPSRTQNSFSHRHAYESRTSVDEKYTELFAKQIAARLDDARKSHSFDQLILIAPPDMLGAVRRDMSSECTRLIRREYSKNLVRQDVKRISDLIMI